MNLQNLLSEHLRRIARERDPYMASGGHFLVREYIRQQLERWGTVATHQFLFRAKTYQNLILDFPASSNGDLPPIIIAAHYDAVPGTPGADDNATGVAVLLELARVFSDRYPFWQQGYRAIMVTDTAMLRNPHYHRPTDTIETLALDFLTGVCQSLIKALRGI